MSKPPRNRVTRRSAAELLDMLVGTPPSPISRVVSAVCAPATPAEISGESDAVMLFTAAISASSSPQRRRFMLKPALANLFAAKLATVGGAAAAAVATGGIAVAAVTGNLPTQGDDHPRPHPMHTIASQSPNPSHSPETSPDADDDTPIASHKPVSSRTPEPSPVVKPSPNPSLDGLCRAFQAGALNNDGKADESTAFTVLITAAGGKDKVTSYCATRIGTPKPHGESDNHGKPSDTPGHGHDGNGSNDHGSDHRPTSTPAPTSEHPGGH
jgi:hypothetical protein